MAEIERPVILLGAPRSGTTLLFSILSSSPELWSLYDESETIFRRYLHPSKFAWKKGNQLDEGDLTEDLRRRLRKDFYRRAMNLQRLLPDRPSRIYAGRPGLEKLRRRLAGVSRIGKPERIRLVEKTPKNCLRVAFLDALFPDAKFVFLTRDGRSNVASLLEGWLQGGRFRTYELPIPLEIEGYAEHRRWTFVLPPGWEAYCQGRSLVEVCAFQYSACNEAALAGLAALGAGRVFRLRYEDLTRRSRESVRGLCEFLDLEYTGAVAAMSENLPQVNTSTAPSPEKWKRHAEAVASVLPRLRPTLERLGYPADDPA